MVKANVHKTNEKEVIEKIPSEDKPRRIQTAEGWKRSMLKKKKSDKSSEKSSEKSKAKKNAA